MGEHPSWVQPSRSQGRKKSQIFLSSPEETFAAELCGVSSKHLSWETRASLRHLLYPLVIPSHKGNENQITLHCEAILDDKQRGQPTTSSPSLPEPPGLPTARPPCLPGMPQGCFSDMGSPDRQFLGEQSLLGRQLHYGFHQRRMFQSILKA